MLEFRKYLLPLFAVDKSKGFPNSTDKFRYLGVSYHINTDGNIATCKHVIEEVLEHETLYGIEMNANGESFEVKNIHCHSQFDFAIGTVERSNYEVLNFSTENETFIGTDILAFGFIANGIVNNRVEAVPRLQKGYVVRVHDSPEIGKSKTICEISFPALKGFSGTPILDSKDNKIVGMIYGNSESYQLVHSISEIEEDEKLYKDTLHRMLEFGRVHTSIDICNYLKDLGVPLKWIPGSQSV